MHLNLSFRIYTLFIIFFPLSITISQTFAILSTIIFLYSSYKDKKKLKLPIIFYFAILIYLSLFIGIIFNFLNYNNFLKSILNSEISDFWMSFIIIPSYYFFKSKEYRNKLFRIIFISSLLVFLSGLISIFTPFRIGKFISSGFKITDGDRLQHFAGVFFGIQTYLPIGLMNTHLTFGSLLGLFFPGIVIEFILKFNHRKIGLNLLYFIYILLFTILILFNQSRSIWLGILFCILLFLFRYEFKLSRKKIFLFTIFISLSVIILFFIYKNNWLLQRAFQESLEHSTENQRYFIYKNTLNLIKENPFFGVGAGRFTEEHKFYSDRLISENEQLWYELEITPRQHAHHDFLHFYSIGGIFTLIFLFLFWLYIQYNFHLKKIESYFFIGIFTVFIAGFFQSYMLDDEFVLPFFAFLGFFFGCIEEEKKKINLFEDNPSDTFQVESLNLKMFFNPILSLLYKLYDGITLKEFLLLILPLSFSVGIIFIQTNKAPEQVYKRKFFTRYMEDKKIIISSLANKFSEMKTSHMQTNEDKIRIEGCLTHLFKKPIQIRKEPYRIEFNLPEFPKNPPSFVEIEVLQRDAFDQDKLYRVHKIKSLDKIFHFALYPKENYIQIEDIYANTNSEKFPENIYFRDFNLFFGGFDQSKEYFDFPSINFKKNCL